jgi:hypothetical protein
MVNMILSSALLVICLLLLVANFRDIKNTHKNNG